MNEVNDKVRIRRAFIGLRKMGWFARQNFYCCMTCGCAAVPESYKNKYVFYHRQDAEHIEKNGNIGKYGLYLCHGEGGNTKEIIKVLRKNGLKVRWNGDMDKRICVGHKKIKE